MKKIIFIIFSMFIFINTTFAGIDIDLENNKITISSFETKFTYKEGDDGRVVAYPTGYTWSTKEGDDGRVVAYPTGYTWSTKEGSDGRVVAYPTGYTWSTKEGDDGRVVAYPTGYTWSTKEGSDGRVVAYPTGYTWSTKEGSDGRVVAYPIGKIDKIEIINISVGDIKYLQEIEDEFSSSDDFINYVLYYWINYDETKGTKKYNNSTNYDFGDYSNIYSSTNNCGLNSYKNSDGKCSCNLGYKWEDYEDSSNLNCVKITLENTCVDKINGYLGTDYKCYCNVGYSWSNASNKCIKQKTDKELGTELCKQLYGNYSYSDGSKASNGGYNCYCNQGYNWNNNQDSCIIKNEVNKTVEINLDTKIKNKIDIIFGKLEKNYKSDIEKYKVLSAKIDKLIPKQKKDLNKNILNYLNNLIKAKIDTLNQ